MDFNFPVGIAIHHETKQIFVADSKNDCVQAFTNDLSFLRTITPLAPEEFKTPYDVGVDNGGILYVAEHKNHCISKITTSGEFLCRFGLYGYSPGQLYYPTALNVNMLVYVAEYNSRVSIFDTEGNHLHCFGKKLSGDKKFTCPCGIATDTLGEVYVSDTYCYTLLVCIIVLKHSAFISFVFLHLSLTLLLKYTGNNFLRRISFFKFDTRMFQRIYYTGSINKVA